MISTFTQIMQQKKIQQWIAKPNHQLVVGLVSPEGRNVWVNGHHVTDGQSIPELVYEICSVTKTFIGLLLAIGEENGFWKSTDSIASIASEWASSDFAQQTTLLDLVTHTSGLPRIHTNIKQTIQDQRDPYANYSEKDLAEVVLAESVRTKKSFGYSNYGYGLLGWLLSKRLGQSLHDALNEWIFKPLQMEDSGLAGHLDDSEQLVPIFNSKGESTPHWKFQDSTAGAGALRSTISDMLNYIEANLGLKGDSIAASTLARCQQEHFALQPKRGIGIGYGWMRYKEKDGTLTHWHNGGSYGSNSYATFNRDKRSGFVILSNYGPNMLSYIPLLGAGKFNTDKVAKPLIEYVFGRS